ncbi:hypothetical protein HMPREF2907_00910 [Neisseria sp. HMSC055H02]|nr:hypothetical protein HMPREF2907_00910 [Neisseria sp. HMSC055H02]
MANAIEKNEFTQYVYLVEPGDKVIGGADAPINQPLQALANRTNNLNIRLKAVDKKISENTDTVKITGDQTINGDKTFGGNTVFTKGIAVAASPALYAANKYIHIDSDADQVFLRNKNNNKALALKNNGVIEYDNSPLLLQRSISHNPEHTGTNTVPSSYALSKLKAETIDVSPSSSGSKHRISIGWDVPGLVAKVDQIFFNVSAPSGTVVALAGESVPYGWLECHGAALSRQTYATLFAVIGTRYGAGDGSTTFNLPDLRGEFIRGWDAGRGRDIGRVLGSWQADEFRSHTHGIGVRLGADTDRGHNPSTVSVDNEGTTAAAGGVETRPMNVAMKYIIKI